MYYENRKRWDNDITTAQIEKFLVDNGFKKSDENDRWLSFEDDKFCDVDLDFDPYMHIDEDDDVICYDVPCYVYFDYVDYNDAVCVTDLETLKYHIERCRKMYDRDIWGDLADDDEN